jgi:hypothetical protein
VGLQQHGLQAGAWIWVEATMLTKISKGTSTSSLASDALISRSTDTRRPLRFSTSKPPSEYRPLGQL